MWYFLGYWLGVMSILLSGESVVRALEHLGNRNLPNQLLPIDMSAQAVRRGYFEMGDFIEEALSDGFTNEKAAVFYNMTESLLDLGILINASFKGIITDNEFESRAKQLGYKIESAKIAIEAAKSRMGTGEVTEAKLRKLDGQFGIKDYYDELLAQGWTAERIATFQALRLRLPATNDIFNFAAWNVYDKNFVSAVGLDKGKPVSYYDDLAKLGITKDLADNFWEAHWQVPSLFILKELFQTGQITEEDLKKMLEAYQIAPSFISAITAAFYKQLSESELTNLLKEGLITADSLPQRLLNTGISKADAALKAQEIILKAHNPSSSEKTAKQLAKEQFLGLSLANVEQAYIDKIISRETASGYLKDLGESQEVIDLHLSLIDHKIASQNQKQEIDDISSQVKLGLLSTNDALDLLGQLNLTAAQIDHILTKISKAVKIKTLQPTKTELDAFVKAGLIDQNFYLQSLSKLGYSEQAVGLFSNEIALKLNNQTIWPLLPIPSVNPLPSTK